MGNTETKGRREGRETQHDVDTDPESHVSERFHVDLVDPRTPFTSSVDAVVCYIDKQWSDSDQLNSTLLDLGGNRYESHRTHLRTKYPQCSVGDVHIGRGEKLPCEVVLFCVVPMVAEDGQIGEDYGQMVTMAIDKVFHTALSCTQEINIRSIAFPMATGPPTPDASVLLPLLFYKYSQLPSDSNLRHIHVITTDQGSWQSISQTVGDFQRVLRDTHSQQACDCMPETPTSPDGVINQHEVQGGSVKIPLDQDQAQGKDGYVNDNANNDSDNSANTSSSSSRESSFHNDLASSITGLPSSHNGEIGPLPGGKDSIPAHFRDTENRQPMALSDLPSPMGQGQTFDELTHPRNEMESVLSSTIESGMHQDFQLEDTCGASGERKLNSSAGHVNSDLDHVYNSEGHDKGHLGQDLGGDKESLKKDKKASNKFVSFSTTNELKEIDSPCPKQIVRSESNSSTEGDPLDFQNVIIRKPPAPDYGRRTVRKPPVIEVNYDPEVLEAKDSGTYFCVICQTEKANEFQKKLDCEHIFCEECIDGYFARRPQCPVCKRSYGVVQGNMPFGIMSHYTVTQSLPGYEHERGGTIVIEYDIPDGVQTEEHPNPGSEYKGCQRTAFLPNNEHGQRMYSLLERAFERRLTFTIGTSRTTGKENVVTWNDIHHKTNLQGGPQRYGFPDPDYLDRLEQELAAIGIHDRPALDN